MAYTKTPPAPETVSVDAHSRATGNRVAFNGHNPHNERGASPAHRAADVLHGWSEYAYHYAKPVMLSRVDYLAALKASGGFKTHPAAMAPTEK